MTVDDPFCLPSPESALTRRSRRLGAFAPMVRPQVKALAERSREIEDLADSFPALLFALATSYGTAKRRASALAAVESGVPLRVAADAFGLPFWLRRLPPAAFVAPLGALPSDAEVGERIGSLLPPPSGDPAAWLAAVLYAYRACHAEYALWVAAAVTRQPRLLVRPSSEGTLRFLAAWAWHSGAPDTIGHKLLRRPWAPQIGIRRALDEVAVWRRRLALEVQIAAAPIPDWLRDGEALGFTFHGLRSALSFVEEACAMDNCLDQFSERLEGRRSHVFSIRQHERRIADVEIGIVDVDSRMPSVLQLRGPRNRRAGPEIWQAAYAWLGALGLRPLPLEPADLTPEGARRGARALWQPYLDALEDRATARAIAEALAGEIGLEPESLLAPARRRAAHSPGLKSEDGEPSPRRARRPRASSSA